MPQPTFQLYKHIRISGKWRYCRAAIYSNGKVKPHVVVVGAQEEKHEEGSYCICQKNLGSKLAPIRWKPQQIRSKFVDQTEYTAVQPAAITKSTSLAQASERYFTNPEAPRARCQEHPTYRSGVNPFVRTCKKVYVEDADDGWKVSLTKTSRGYVRGSPGLRKALSASSAENVCHTLVAERHKSDGSTHMVGACLARRTQICLADSEHIDSKMQAKLDHFWKLLVHFFH